MIGQGSLESAALPPQLDGLALMLGGGGARGAYQAGVLHGLARRFPDLRFPIMTGISAGAINTIHLASRDVSLGQATKELIALWLELTPERVYDVRAVPLFRNVMRWGGRLLSGGTGSGPEPIRGMVDSQPLRRFLGRNLEQEADGALAGIARNIARGSLNAVALSATSYATGQSMTWVEGQHIKLWQRPQRRSQSTRLTLEHVMASSALPMLFPAVRVGDEWFGDGGIRMTAPLSPALHLGATRILTISTRRQPARADVDVSLSRRYPPPAQVFGVLYNSVFLDLIDEDILRLKRVNRLLANVSPEKRGDMRPVDIMVIRPSRDLRTVVRELEPRLPSFVRYLTRGLGTRDTTSPDFLSLFMFQPDYIRRLIELGEADAEAQASRVEAFLHRPVEADGRAVRRLAQTGAVTSTAGLPLAYGG
jgi:NTE family protein